MYCGLGLHARSLYVCIHDEDGSTLNAPANGKRALSIIAPCRHDLLVAVECIFTWYWPAAFAPNRALRLFPAMPST